MLSKLHNIEDKLRDGLSTIQLKNKKSTFKSEQLVNDGLLFLESAPNAKAKLRANLVILLAYGYSMQDIKNFCTVSFNSLYTWYKKAKNYGFSSLIAKKQPGKIPALDESKKQHLREVIQDDSSKYGYEVWQGKTLSSYIEKKFGITLKVRRCQYLLKEFKTAK